MLSAAEGGQGVGTRLSMVEKALLVVSGVGRDADGAEGREGARRRRNVVLRPISSLELPSHCGLNTQL